MTVQRAQRFYTAGAPAVRGGGIAQHAAPFHPARYRLPRVGLVAPRPPDTHGLAGLDCVRYAGAALVIGAFAMARRSGRSYACAAELDLESGADAATRAHSGAVFANARVDQSFLPAMRIAATAGRSAMLFAYGRSAVAESDAAARAPRRASSAGALSGARRIEAMKVAELKAELAACALPTEGLKAALVARLLDHHGLAARTPKARGAARPEKPNPQSRTSSTTRAHLTASKFSELAISPAAKKALADVFNYTKMTTVQAESIPVSL